MFRSGVLAVFSLLLMAAHCPGPEGRITCPDGEQEAGTTVQVTIAVTGENAGDVTSSTTATFEGGSLEVTDSSSLTPSIELPLVGGTVAVTATLTDEFGRETSGSCGIEVVPTCACTSDSECDDSDACNGIEICEDCFCVASTPAVVCGGGFQCDPATAECACMSDGACNDGLFCTGAETCVDGECQSSGDPCAPGGFTCLEDFNACAVQ